MDFDDLDDVEAELGASAAEVAAEAAKKEAAERAAEHSRPARQSTAEAPLTRSLTQLSEAQRAKLPSPYEGKYREYTKKKLEQLVNQQLPGEHFGIIFPHSMELFQEMGVEFLNDAFHLAGTLPEDNSVVALKEVIGLSLDPSAGEAMGGAGQKLLLRVEYAKPNPDLHTELFVKIPHPFTTKNQRWQVSCRDLCDEGEIMFNRVVASALPFLTPKYYFGDINRTTTNCCLITEKLNMAKEWKPLADFEPMEIFPAMTKNKDYTLPEKGKPMYLALGKAMGRLAGAYHSGVLGPKEEMERLFFGLTQEVKECWGHGWPPKWHTDASMRERLKDAAAANANKTHQMCEVAIDFMTNVAPQLFSEELKDKVFLRRFVKEAVEVAQYEVEINTYMGHDPAFMSLVHGNLQIDNAYYWKNAEGEVVAGLLDWGGVSFDNAVTSMARNWCGAEPEVMDEIDEQILENFVKELERTGGPRITRTRALQVARLLQGTFCFAMAVHVSQLYQYKDKKDPFWKDLSGPRDPRVEGVFDFRYRIYNWKNQLMLWKSQRRSPYKAFCQWRDENPWLMRKKPFDLPG